MAPPRSADIVPFPGRIRAAPGVDPAGGEESRIRLQRALRALEAAIAAQRAAVAGWRAALGDLAGSVGTLEASMQAYHRRLGTLGAEVAAVGSQARQLERWADAAARAGQPVR